MSKKYEVWVDGKLVGKRESRDRDYSHAVVGRKPIWQRREDGGHHITGWDMGHKVLSFAGNLRLAQARMNEWNHCADLAVVAVTRV